MKFNVTLDEFKKAVNSKEQKEWFKEEIEKFERDVLDDDYDFNIYTIYSMNDISNVDYNNIHDNKVNAFDFLPEVNNEKEYLVVSA
ncbi:hypothetical protein AKUH4B410M_04920 [Apilactobacillus kunkeei]|nr:hypothetical protein AKUH4B405J_04920 [Apilactobacillus kunkeei]CAI2581285.1 hypothetical protein AKUH4B102A_04940 [Apilactobacillus kunkeei]CAI2582258.1 hypothetical protein AKUH4B410M_04920 [Apilactobacillus kunkeei]CAI2653199.1 hypothetical protein AKUH3B102X_04910 [Apilactobacillus kunkeei]